MAVDNPPTSPAAGAWQGRPAGIPGAVPPPPVPLSFLAAASLGLVACGAAWIWAAGAAAGDPTADGVVAAAHLGMLATLSMGVLGALHQFTPVVTGRPLRSLRLAHATFISWLGAAWLLPLGFATERETVVEAGGGLAALAVTLVLVNLSSPLAVRGKGPPVVGLRFALAGFVATACFGVVYVADRRGSWFDLSGHVVLAHAIIGLFAWLGLVYVSVAEKLWPMFFLAHVPGRRLAGRVAVWAVPAGVALLSPGLLFGVVPLAVAGAAVLVVGLGGHLVSLGLHVRHRRRPPDLHLLFVLTSAAWLLIGAALALAAFVVIGDDHHEGMALAAAAVAAFGGWLLETLVGHAHKVVPFVGWAALRARGVDKNGAGKPLMFSDLYDHRWAALCYAAVTVGIASLCAGLVSSTPAASALGGVLFVLTGLVAAANLSVKPVRMLSSRATGTASPRPQAARVERSSAAHPSVPTGVSGLPPSSKRPAEVTGRSGRDWPSTVSLVAIALASVAVVMAGLAWSRSTGTTTDSAVTSAAVVPNGRTENVAVSLGEFYVRPSAITIAYGTRLVLDVTNRGGMRHDLQLEGGATGTGFISPGHHKTADYGLVGRSEEAWCTLPGHKAAGMILHIAVSGGPPGASRAPAASSAQPSTGSPTPDATIDFSAAPPPGWRVFAPTLAPDPGGTVHHITLTAEDQKLQVAPGVTQEMWTFDGQVPAPTLRGHVGDLFDVTLVNHTDMDHSIDFHAANEPMEAMRAVAPGQSVTYEFRAAHAGIFLYHCGTAPVLEHLANGMYGAVIIDPPNLPAVTHEYLMVQSELYLGPPGQSGDYTKMLHGQPDAVVFNGYVNQYLDSPLQVRQGDRIRIWVLDAGPNQDGSFHVVGEQFDTVFKEGAYLLRADGPTEGASQALDLSAAQGGFVEFTVGRAGQYEMLDHHLDHALNGAAGYLSAS